MVYHLGHTVKDIKLDAIIIDPNVSHSQTGAFDVFPHSPCWDHETVKLKN